MTENARLRAFFRSVSDARDGAMVVRAGQSVIAKLERTLLRGSRAKGPGSAEFVGSLECPDTPPSSIHGSERLKDQRGPLGAFVGVGGFFVGLVDGV